MTTCVTSGVCAQKYFFTYDGLPSIIRDMETQRAKSVAEVIEVITSNGLIGKLRVIYNHAQDHGCDCEEYAAIVSAGNEEGAAWFAHDRGIEAVWMFLVDAGLIDSDASKSHDAVDLAFSELC